MCLGRSRSAPTPASTASSPISISTPSIRRSRNSSWRTKAWCAIVWRSMRPRWQSRAETAAAYLARLHGARRRVKACQQHGKNPGEENAVKGPGAADGGDRRAEPAHFVEIGDIGADQGAEA